MIADRTTRTLRFRRPFVSPRTLVPLVLVVSILSGCAPAVAPESHKEVDAVVRAAESLFQAMQKRDYGAIWKGISARSRDAIVSDTVRAIAASGDRTATAQAVRKEFEESGPLAREYWNGYLARFDPGLVLEGSRWEEVKLGKERAEIRIVYKRAQNPAYIQMFREGGAWKVGLAETFEAR